MSAFAWFRRWLRSVRGGVLEPSAGADEPRSPAVARPPGREAPPTARDVPELLDIDEPPGPVSTTRYESG